MELAEIRSFVVVGDSGSVSRAADILRVSQPAVTRRIQRLEAALGILLLDRHARPPALTASGTRLLEPCRNVLKAVDAVRAAVPPSGRLTGELRLGIVSSLADLALAKVADQLKRAFPRLTVRFTIAWSDVLMEGMRTGALDAAIVYRPHESALPAGVVAQRLTTISLLFVAPRERRPRPIVDLADISRQRWVLNPQGCAFRAAVTHMLDEAAAPLNLAVEVQGVNRQLSLVARGAGLGCVPAQVVRRSPLRSRLTPFRIRNHEFALPVWAIHRGLPAITGSVLPVIVRTFARL
ncbi:MAG TPA: LysR family transcriptional regulator [Methylomirabilota bacterium]|nr:LysR family transcriptional regulator [Methylomirabilota bacterium]